MAKLLRAFAVAFLVSLPGCNAPTTETDAAVPDANRDAFVAPCTTATDCDDGLFCTGIEACNAGRCAAGTPMACDDGIACTRDLCSESFRRCISSAPDEDGDGIGAITCLDASGTPLGEDCADGDALRFPGNAEVCDPDGHDEDCDDASLGAVDSDGDGFVDARCCNGAACGDDCNDGARGANPLAPEVCNTIDDDCDTRIDEMVVVPGFDDLDHDGFGDPARPRDACGGAVGFSAIGTDCDDDDVSRNPAQVEICDMQDNDCDPQIDEAASAVTWFRDLDGDGFGSVPSGTTSACIPPAGYSLRSTDCNDAVAGISPGSAETCNGIDDDCSGAADYPIAAGDLEDDDGDGIADVACGPPRGLDCDDRDALSGGGAVETCDGRDNDCDGRMDEDATLLTFVRDLDGDGYGAMSSGTVLGCVIPAGYARRGGDCNDDDELRNPGGVEGCNALDDDCDGTIDEGSAAAMCAGVPHALATCVVGHCIVVTCEPGWESCDVTPPACETDLENDPDDCGVCGRACAAGQYCSMGACGPTPAGSVTSFGMDPDGIIAVTTDPSGDYYFTGSIGNESFILGRSVTADFAGDVIVARVGRDGTLRWLETFGGVGADRGSAILLGPSALVVAGYSRSNSITFGPDTFTPGDTRFHAFVTRLDPATGAVIAGTTFLPSTVDARLDGLARVGDRVVAVGTLSGTADVPVILSHYVTVGFDALAIGFDESDGLPVWSRLSSGTAADAWIAVTSVGADVFAVGQSTSPLGMFSHGTRTTGSTGAYDMILGSMNADTGAAGVLVHEGGAGDEFPTGLTTVGSNVCASGTTTSTDAAFGAGFGGIDGVIVCWETTGGAERGYSRFGAAGADSVSGIASDATGSLFVSGTMSAAFDLGGGAIGGPTHAFLASFSGALVHRFSIAEPLGTTGTAPGVAVAADGHLFLAGSSAGGGITPHIWLQHYAP